MKNSLKILKLLQERRAVDKIKIHTHYGQSAKGRKKTHFDAAIKRAEHFNPHLHNLSSTSVR